MSELSLSRITTGATHAVRSRTAIWLGAIAATSAVVHGALTRLHTGPRFFPDEYLYATISRSIAHGHLEVRGHAAGFPALLQPILAAPVWRFLPPVTAYHTLQLGNAVAASLVVIPLWVLGRELRLPRRVVLLACGFGVSLPMLALIPATISDFLAYPLAIAAIAAAVRSLVEPTPRRQALFLSIAVLATLGRVQYFVLVPAYIVGALVMDRRRAVRRHAIAFVAIAPAIVGVLVALTGFYAIDIHKFDATAAKWFGIQAFLVALPAGVAIVPGAVVALLRPRDRVQTAFATVAGSSTLLLLAEASVWSGGRFKERYLFVLLPLLALAFGVYLRNGAPHVRFALAIGAGLVVAAAWLPISGFTQDAPSFDSQSLVAAWLLQYHVGSTAASALVIGFVALGVGLALALVRVPSLRVVPLVLAVVVGIASLSAAVYVDNANVKSATSSDPAWIDEAVHGAPVTAIATPSSGRVQLLRQLYWNGSIDRELILPGASGTDTYAPHRFATISQRGRLTGVRGYFLFDHTGTQASFWNAPAVASQPRFTLYHSPATPRLRLLVENELETGWLSPLTRLFAWPADSMGTTGVRFSLSLPATAPHRVRLFVGPGRFIVHPGQRLSFNCGARKAPLDIFIFSEDTSLDRYNRIVTVHMTGLRLARPVHLGRQARCWQVG